MTREETTQALKRAGSRRLKAIGVQRAAEAEIRPLLPAASEQGVPLRVLRELTGLSVSTIRLWIAEGTGRAGAEATDGRLTA